MSRRLILKPSLFVLLCLLLAWGAAPVSAATLTVSTTADSGAGSLRDALASAGAGDTINFTITGTIQLLTNLPTISANGLTINGNGATVRGGTNIRIFTIDSNADVTIDNLKMKNGNCASACPAVNASGSDFGGAILSAGTLTISNSTLSGNSAISNGGAIYNYVTLTISNSTFSGNSASAAGGIANEGTVTISSSTFSSNSATGTDGGVIYSAGTVTVSNSTFSGNSAISNGGGIINDSGTLTVSNSTFSGNSVSNYYGGAIASGGTATINNSIFSGNSSTGGTSDNAGGAIGNWGTLTVNNSTLSGNSVPGADGGGIANWSTVTVNNSTLSGNSASRGGSIYSNLTLTVNNSTLSGNSATTGGGSIYNDSGTATLNNTLLGKGASGANCGGSIPLSNGAAYNLANDASCGANVTQVASLGLATLGANGGSTPTIPLVVGSPAIDAGDDAVCAASPINGFDQRGEVRPVGAHCDIGAFEGAITLLPPDLVPTAVPAPALCSLTGFSSSVQVGMSLPNGNNGLNVCYSLITDPAQAGVAQPFTLAADVYTFRNIESVSETLSIQVCLQGAGTLLYRDASGQPRTTVNLPSFSQNGFTCGLIPNAGTVILLPGAPAPAAAILPTALSNCRVTTTNILNLRAEPDTSSAVLTKVPYQTTLSASARSGDWLQVVFGNQQGWLSAGYLTLEGACS